MKWQAKVNQPNSNWLLSAAHKHDIIRHDISADNPAGAQMPKGCSKLLM